MTEQWIVTVKLKRNPKHNPENKQTGACPFNEICTDVTGSHHSLLVKANNVLEVRKKMDKLYHDIHITRIELVKELNKA